MKKHTTCTHPATPAGRAACRRETAMAELLAAPETVVSAVNEVETFHRRQRLQETVKRMIRTWISDRQKFDAVCEELALLPKTNIKAHRIDAGIWDLMAGDIVVGRLTREEYKVGVSGNPRSRLITHYRKEIRFTYNGSDNGYRLDVGQKTLSTTLAVMNGLADA